MVNGREGEVNIISVVTERDLARIIISLDKALKRPQLLGYLREQIKSDMAKNLLLVTDIEIDDYLERKKEKENVTTGAAKS